MSTISTQFHNMRTAAENYFEAQFGDDRCIENLAKLLAIHCVFKSNIPNSEEIQNVNKKEFLHRFDEKHMKNVINVSDRKEDYEKTPKHNKIICNVCNLQERAGKGLGENNVAGTYIISACVKLTFVEEQGMLKISKISQKNYTKSLISDVNA